MTMIPCAKTTIQAEHYGTSTGAGDTSYSEIPCLSADKFHSFGTKGNIQ